MIFFTKVRKVTAVGFVASSVALLSSCSQLNQGHSLFSKDFQECIMDAKKKVFPAVVYIRGVSENLDYGKSISGTVIGSGVVISKSGEVLTNWHVVNKMSNIRCQLSDGRAYSAKVIGSDKDTDLALLQLELKTKEQLTSVAEIRQGGDLKEGEFVMAMGAPWGLNRSVSIGIISCSRRYLPTNNVYNLWYQTDASISPGNSGGPLVDSTGKVVGINTLGSNMIGQIGFAIPYETILNVVPRLRKYNKANWAWTGIVLQPLNNFDLDINFDFNEGVVITDVESDSPAKVAGIKPFDRIVAINGEKITAQSIEDIPRLNMMLALAPFEEKLVLDIYRGEESKQFEFQPREKGATEGKELELEKWNMTVKTINQFENSDLFFYKKQGVYVLGVNHHDSYYPTSQLRKNDIILNIDGTKVDNLEEISKIYEKTVKNMKCKGQSIVTVLRNGSVHQQVLDLTRMQKN